MTATLIAGAVLSLVATLVAFVVLMSGTQEAVQRPISSERYVDPDPSVLKVLRPSKELKPVHRMLPNCRQLQAARCYLLSLPERGATEAANALLMMGKPQPWSSSFGERAYHWCGAIGEAPAAATLSPHIENAVHTRGNVFRYPGGGPQADGRWVLFVVLQDHDCT